MRKYTSQPAVTWGLVQVTPTAGTRAAENVSPAAMDTPEP